MALSCGTNDYPLPPERIHHPFQGISAAALAASVIISDDIALKSPQPAPISTLPKADLSFSDTIDGGVARAASQAVKLFIHGIYCLPIARLPGSRLSRLDDACGEMSETGRVLMLVPVLAASSRAGIIFQPEVTICPPIIRRSPSGSVRRQHSHGHSRAVDTASPFSRGYALNTVATSLVIEPGGTFTGDF